MHEGEDRAGESARKLVGLFTGIGLAIALVAVFGIGLSGRTTMLVILFWCGWGVITAAMFAGLFMIKAPWPLDGPLKVIQFGIATVILGFAMEYMSGASMRPLWSFGAATMFGGIGWALWSIGGMRE